MTTTIEPRRDDLRRPGDAMPFRRVVIFETPSPDALMARLKELWPATGFELQPDLRLASATGSETVPVFFLPIDEAELALTASNQLRSFFYPLARSAQRFCVAFTFRREGLAARPLDVTTLGVLDLETVGALLHEDTVFEEFATLGALPDRLTLTPIEARLQEAMVSAGLDPRPQVKIDRFRVDFLLEENGYRVAVEADGQLYHDEERDATRDARLRHLGVTRVLRFSGRKIFLDADGCAAEICDALQGRNGHRSAGPRRQSLDNSQKRAVAHRLGPARVLAPAGAGKTRVLVNRIAELLSHGVEPGSILALAFNRKANEQLEERLQAMGIATSRKLFDPASPGVRCATFNAFGHRYQRELLELTHPVEDSAAVWRDLMERALRTADVQLRGAKRGSDPVSDFLHALDIVRADLTPASELEVEIDHFKDGPITVDFEPVYAAFQQFRLDRGIQDFGDQLHVTVLDLLGNPRHREFVQRYFRHVLVDEYQDLNATQLALIDIVSRPNWDLFVVGDDDQLIYGWRFAELTNILDFHKRVPEAPYSATYVLSTNYRCSRAIVETSRRVIDHNQMREPKNIQAAPDAPAGEVRYARSTSWRERADEMVSFLRAHKTGRSRWADLAVLCRYKAQQPLVALALDQAGIPRSPLLSYRLFSDRQMQLLRSYIQLVRDPASVTADDFRHLLNRPNRYLKNELLDEIAAQAAPWSYIKELCQRESAPRALSALHDRRLGRAQRYREQRPTATELIEDNVFDFELDRYWRDEWRQGEHRARDEADPTQLLDLIRLHAQERPDPTAFLEYWDAAAEKERQRYDTSSDTLAREEDPEVDRLVIGTMHSSKGCEYDAVVLWDYDAELESDDTQVEEERRVFYVGLTRARGAALITMDGRSEQIHQFIRESIAPEQTNERDEIAVNLAQLDAREGEVTVHRHKLAQRVVEIDSGAASQRLTSEQTELEAQRASTRSELTELQQELTPPSLLSRLTGKASRRRKRAAALQVREGELQAALDAVVDELVMMDADPQMAKRPITSRLAECDRELFELAEQRAQLTSRREQLALVNPDGACSAQP